MYSQLNFSIAGSQTPEAPVLPAVHAAPFCLWSLSKGLLAFLPQSLGLGTGQTRRPKRGGCGVSRPAVKGSTTFTVELIRATEKILVGLTNLLSPVEAVSCLQICDCAWVQELRRRPWAYLFYKLFKNQ